MLLCVILSLGGCSSKGASYSGNSANIIEGNYSEASKDCDEEASSSENNSSEENKGKNNSSNNSNKNNSSDSNQSTTSSENTSSDTFPKPTVQGGTVIGTTSKGYTITLKNGVTYVDGLLIVNKTYSLPETYNPGIASACSKAFNKMKAAAKKDGVSIWISSSFRSYKSQKKLYEAYCERDGSAAADRYSARPGHSEHQSGYAIDVNSASTVAYQSTYKKVGEWLKANCADFGFIIRYPEGKEGITGYQYEPWHIRYVGTDLAKTIMNSGLTLEEYFGINSSYTTAPPIEDEPDDGEDNNSSAPDDTPSLTPDKDNSSEDNNNSDSGKTENEDNSANQESNIETSCTTEQT